MKTHEHLMRTKCNYTGPMTFVTPPPSLSHFDSCILTDAFL